MILITVEAISVGDQDPDGVLLDIRLIPAVSGAQHEVTVAGSNFRGVAIDSTSDVLVADIIADTFRTYDSDLTLTGTTNFAGMNTPQDLALDSSDNIWFADGNQVKKTTSGGTSLGANTAVTEYPLISVVGVAVDQSTNRVYALDQFRCRVYCFDSTGTYLFSFGWPGTGPACFTTPSGIAVDQGSGEIYVCDRYYVQRFDDTGLFLDRWAVLAEDSRTPLRTTAMVSGMSVARRMPRALRSRLAGNQVVYESEAADESVAWPAKIAVDDVTSQVYVATQGGDPVIQEFSPAGRYRRSLGPRGSLQGELRGAPSMAIDNDTLYTVENDRIQKFALTHPIWAAMLQDDVFQLLTDDGLSALEYHRLIVAESLAYLSANYGLTLTRNDVVVLGWDDARFWGTGSYEDFDDFLAPTSFTGDGTVKSGKYRWITTNTLIVGGGGPIAGTTSKMSDELDHPGIIRLQSGYNLTAGLNGAIVHMAFPTDLHALTLTRATWIGSFDTATITGVMMGLGQGVTETPTHALYAQSLPTDTFWKVVLNDGVTSTSYTTTITRSADQWMRFQISQTGNVVFSAGEWQIEYLVTLTNLETGAVWDDTITFSQAVTDFTRPMWRCIQSGAVANHGQFYVDYFDFRIEGLARVITEG